LKGGVVECRCDDSLCPFFSLDDSLATWINDDRVARIDEAVRIFAYTVNANDIAEILHSTGTKEGTEDLTTRAWPVGYSDDEVIFVRYIAAPHGEAQVVADDGEDVPALECEDGSAGSGAYEILLSPRGEEVTLRLELHHPIGLNEEEEIMYDSLDLTEVAPSKSDIVLVRESEESLVDFALLSVSKLRCFA